MNDINEMPPKCQYCPYWEVCEYPWVCPDREQLATKLQQTCHATDTISRKAAIDAIVNTVSEIGLHDNSEVARYGATFRQHEIIDIIEGMPSAQPEPLTGKEKMIFLAAMAKEENICKQIDDEYRDCELYEDSLVRACQEIERKVRGALWT